MTADAVISALDDDWRLAATWLNQAQAIMITAGAGMGVDSGLPDFRGVDGFWHHYPRYAQLGLRFEELAHPAWFDHDPAMAWGFYGHRWELYGHTQPHAGFALLAQWCQQLPHMVVTSNVDGQFQRAGFSPEAIWEVHGSIHHAQCHASCCLDIWPMPAGYQPQVDDGMRAAHLVHCPHCRSVARPNILMFGDTAWQPQRSNRQEERCEAWLRQHDRSELVIIEIGAGTAVPTIRHLGESWTSYHGARLIRINPRDDDMPQHLAHQTIVLTAGAQIALERLDLLRHEISPPTTT